MISSRGSARRPRCHLRSILTCCATPPATSSRTMATTRAPCSTISVTKKSSIPSAIPSFRPTGFATFGGISVAAQNLRCACPGAGGLSQKTDSRLSRRRGPSDVYGLLHNAEGSDPHQVVADVQPVDLDGTDHGPSFFGAGHPGTASERYSLIVCTTLAVGRPSLTGPFTCFMIASS